jgi:predicted amidophosphoribosyltransferase
MTTLIDAAADLFLGACCPGCGDPGLKLCDACRADLMSALAEPHAKAALAGLPHWAAGPYDGLTSRLITAAKDRHRWDVIDVLGDRLALAVAGLLDEAGWSGTCWLVPVPSDRRAVRRRGLDFGAKLAVAAGHRLEAAGLDHRIAHLLRPRRRVADQSGLGYAGRLANLRGAYEALPPRPPQPLWAPAVLVDDVATTGASLAEGVRALRAAGLEVLGAATVAATRDRD